MKPNTDLPIDFLRACFHLDPIIGTITWKHRPRAHFNNDNGHRIFNTQHAGKTAFTAVSGNGYRHTKIRFEGRSYDLLAHRVTWALSTGAWPVAEIDHRARTRDDNRPSELREASRNFNGFNRHTTNRTGRTGVSQTGSRYSVRIRTPEGKRYVGTYDTPQEAGRIYDLYAVLIHGETLTR